jgi:signal transduction histidine kinase
VSEIERQIENSATIGLIREQAEQLGRMLREQRSVAAQLGAVLAALSEGIVLADEQGTIVLANRSTHRILQLDRSSSASPSIEGASIAGALIAGASIAGASLRDACIGEPVGTLFAACSPESRRALCQALASYSGTASGARPAPGQHKQTTGPKHDASAEEACREPASVLLDIQERVVRASLTPMLDEEERFVGTVIVLRDVTLEQEVARAKNDFVSLVSHELRTPMTSIKGYTDLMLKGAVGALNDQQRNFMTVVKSNVDRMADLVSDLLDVSRIEAGRVRLLLERLDLASIILEISQELAETMRQRELAMHFDLPPGLPSVCADRGRVIQVLLNLLSNAYRYTPPGGKVTVAVHALDGEVQVDVTDTGIGIPEHDREAVFERFYRAEHPVVREQAGTGLGLPIARSLIEMHGGRLWLRSEVQVGSTFSFTLPVYTGDLAGRSQTH